MHFPIVRILVPILTLTTPGLIVQAYHLTIEPDNVEVGVTENVTIACSGDENIPEGSSNNVRMLTIWKGSVDTGDVLASVFGMGAVESIVEIRARGHIRNASDCELQIVWPIATEQAVGSYQCEIMELTEEGERRSLQTNSATVTEL